MRRLGALTVDDCRARAGVATRLLAHHHVKRMVDAIQRAVPIPQLEIMVHRAFRRQILGQRLPLASGPQQIEKAVDNLAHVDVPRPTATSCRRNHRRHQAPFFIGEITHVTQTLTPCRGTMFRCPHRAFPSPANQRLIREPQPIRPTQQVLGSALRSIHRMLRRGSCTAPVRWAC